MRKIFHECCSVSVVMALLSLGYPHLCSAQTQNANRLVLKHQELFKPLSPSNVQKVEQLEDVPSYALLKRYPFLRTRPKQSILKGTRTLSGKGEEWKFEKYLLRTDQGTFELNAIGSSEFVHFDWEVSTENAEILFRGMFREGIGVYMVPTQQYDRIKQQIGDKYPNSIVNRLPTTVAPPKLVAQSGRAYVRCEAIVYIRDGYYPDEGRVENSFVKYAVNLGNGFLESEVDVLIRGPYRTDPVYWNVVNGTRPPSDEEERKAIVREFEDMKEFQKVAIELLGKTEETHAK